MQTHVPFTEGKSQFPEQPKEAFLDIKIQLDVEIKDPEVQKEKLASLVEGRNELVHHFLEQIEFDDLDSWKNASLLLDAQREDIIFELDYFRNLATSLINVVSKLPDYLTFR